MRFTRTLVVVLFSSLLPAVAFAQDERQQPSRPTVAVLAFDTGRTGWMPPPGFGETVAELLTDRLVAAGQFRVIDCGTVVPEVDERGRNPLAMLREKVIGTGIQFAIVGSVTRLSLEKHSSTGGGILPIPIVGGIVRRHKTESIVGLTLRVIDLQSGEIVATAIAEGSGSAANKSGGGVALVGKLPIFGAKGSSSSGIQDGLLAAAIQEAVASVAQQLTAAAPQLALHGR